MTTLPLEEVKTHLSELVDRVHDQHERVTVTVHGRPSAILLAIDDLERLEETLAILRDADAMRRLDDADAELARGETVSAEELAQVIFRRRSSAGGTGVGGGVTSLNEREIHSLTRQIDEALQVTGLDESASGAAGVSRRRLAGGDEW